MKKRNFIFLIIIYLLLSLVFSVNDYKNSFAKELNEYDYSSPTKSFKSLQKAVKNKDYQGVMIHLYKLISARDKTTGKPVENFEDFIKGRESANWQDELIFFQEAEVIREEILFDKLTSPDILYADVSYDAGVRLWIKWKKWNKIGYLLFAKVDEKWYWGGSGEGQEFIFPPYDFSTPIKTFLSIQQALAVDILDEDIFTIFTTISSNLKKDITFEDYEKLINAMKKKEREGRQGKPYKRTWSYPDFQYYEQNELEEEMLKPEKNIQKCKVWKLDKNKNRLDFELFVKEGKDWKWIPDPEDIWHPTAHKAVLDEK